MNALQTALWRRIDEYSLDEIGDPLPFSARLARDNNWSPSFARRAIQEYKKFVLLAVTAGHPVTPSDEVDQVWHLHLLYTRSYWEDFCKILGGPLHHGPTKGGAHEGRKFYAWYENTLRSYAQVFATVPPPDIWPDSASRFGDATHFRRINARAYWMIPRPRLPMPVGMAVVTAPLWWLAGCDLTTKAHRFETVLLLVVLIAVIWSIVSPPDNAKKNKKKDDNSSGGGGCGAGDGGGCGGCGG